MDTLEDYYKLPQHNFSDHNSFESLIYTYLTSVYHYNFIKTRHLIIQLVLVDSFLSSMLPTLFGCFLVNEIEVELSFR